METKSCNLGDDEAEWVDLHVSNFSAYIRGKIQEDMTPKNEFATVNVNYVNGKKSFIEGLMFIVIGVSLILMSLPTLLELTTSSFLMVSGVVLSLYGMFQIYQYTVQHQERKRNEEQVVS